MEKRLGHARSFRELEVYKQARELSGIIFKLTRNFPKEEKYSLTDQIRRSSRSIGAQIAESWGKRRYENHFVLKLTDSDAEQYETQHWIEVSFECEYVDENMKNDLMIRCESIGRMLNSMIEKASLFCQKS
ncbi:MAG: four helix bundle protein [Mariniphaga sp.]|nr:four helix bundle protein [Mariniphaga sp.]